MVVLVDEENFIKTFDGFFIFFGHGKGDTKAVESGDIVGKDFENLLVQGDSLVPVFVDRGFDGALLKVV